MQDPSPVFRILVDADDLLRVAVSRLFRDSTLSREAVAENLSKLTGEYIRVHVLYDITGRKSRLPASFVGPLCTIFNDFELLRIVVGPHLGKLIELERRSKSGVKRGRA